MRQTHLGTLGGKLGFGRGSPWRGAALDRWRAAILRYWPQFGLGSTLEAPAQQDELPKGSDQDNS
jgi:hypothetical protein